MTEEIKDVRLFILTKACEQSKIIYEKDTKWQEGFHAGCRFMEGLFEEFKDRERQLAEEISQIGRRN